MKNIKPVFLKFDEVSFAMTYIDIFKIFFALLFASIRKVNYFGTVFRAFLFS